MLILLDLDGTIITSYMDNPDRDYHTWEPLPRRGYRVRQLRAAGHIVGIVTNQGGMAFGKITMRDWEDKLTDVCYRLQIDWESVYVCFSDVRGSAPYNDPNDAARRKPGGAMIREAMDRYAYQPNETMFIGDRPEDQQAAADAGVAFEWSKEFFHDE